MSKIIEFFMNCRMNYLLKKSFNLKTRSNELKFKAKKLNNKIYERFYE